MVVDMRLPAKIEIFGDILNIRSDIGYVFEYEPEYFIQRAQQEIIPILEQYASYNNVIIDMAVEEATVASGIIPSVNAMNNLMAQVQASRPELVYTILLNDNHVTPGVREELEKLSNVIYCHWFLMPYYYHYSNSIHWNHTAGKALFLPGKINKAHRIYPIYSLYKQDKLTTEFVYSLLGKPSDGITDTADINKWYSELLYQLTISECDSGITVDDIKSLMSKLENDIDGTIDLSIDCGKQVTRRVDTGVYSQTSAELLSETWNDDNNHLTEKSWRPILAGQPFFHVVESFNTRLLDLGYRTFDKYCDRLESDGSIRSQTDNAISQISKFIKLCKDNELAENIKNDIMHNRNLARATAQHTINTLNRRHPGFADIAEEFFTKNEYESVH